MQLTEELEYDNQRPINVAGARENVGTRCTKVWGIQVTTAEYGLIGSWGSVECRTADWKMITEDVSEEGIGSTLLYIKKFQAELISFKDVNYASKVELIGYASKVEIDCAKAKGDLMSYKIDFAKSSTNK
ncbi:hypothetical protein Tco_0183231 [Tanacetum coccineum]